MDGQEKINEPAESTITPEEIAVAKENVEGVEVSEVNESAMDEKSIEEAKLLSRDKEFQDAIKGSHFFEDIAKKFHKMPKVVALAAGLWIASVKGAFGADKIEEVGAPKQPTATLMAKAEQPGKTEVLRIEHLSIIEYQAKDESLKSIIDNYNSVSTNFNILKENEARIKSFKDEFDTEFGDDFLKELRRAGMRINTMKAEIEKLTENDKNGNPADTYEILDLTQKLGRSGNVIYKGKQILSQLENVN